MIPILGFSSILARIFSSRIYTFFAFFTTIFPLLGIWLTNTGLKIAGSMGAGFVTYQLGEVLFETVFGKISNYLSGYDGNFSPLFDSAFAMIPLLGIDTAFNIMASFYFALMTVKGIDKFGRKKRSAWNAPRKMGENGTLDNSRYSTTETWDF